MKATDITPSIVALVVANLVPLVGVFLFGWDAGAIVLLYWIENLVVGFYALLKFAFLKVEKPTDQLWKIGMGAFFLVHFGGFCAIHGLFLLTFFNPGGGFPDPDLRWWPGPFMFVGLLVSVIMGLWESRPPGMEWPVIGLLVSHGISFVQNYLMGGEYKSGDMGQAMTQPYGRIVLMHVTILAGALPVMLLGSPLPLLVILIGLKIVVDVALHRRSHRGKGQGGGGDGDAGPGGSAASARRAKPRRSRGKSRSAPKGRTPKDSKERGAGGDAD